MIDLGQRRVTILGASPVPLENHFSKVLRLIARSVPNCLDSGRGAKTRVSCIRGAGQRPWMFKEFIKITSGVFSLRGLNHTSMPG